MIFRSDLKVDSDGYTIVHTDGACSDNGRSNAKAGLLLFFLASNMVFKNRIFLFLELEPAR